MPEIFRFKQFNIKQNPKVFKIGTDGVLLGCLAEVSQAQNILDIGTGTGLLALMCAQKNPQARITALDSEAEAVKTAKENAKASPFASRISVIHTELDNFTSPDFFEYIICNPPYFQKSELLHQKHPMARCQLTLSYDMLLRKSSEMLSENGLAGIIFPFEEEQNVLDLAEKYGLFPQKIVRIAGIRNGKIRRTFLEVSKKRNALIMRDLYIEETPRIWSEEYKKLTSEFYLKPDEN